MKYCICGYSSRCIDVGFTNQIVNQFRSQLDEVIRAKDVKLGNVLLEEIGGFFFQLTMIYQLVGILRGFDSEFHSLHWADSNRARTLINKGLQIISENPNVNDLRPIVVSLYDLLPMEERPSGDDSVLVG